MSRYAARRSMQGAGALVLALAGATAASAHWTTTGGGTGTGATGSIVAVALSPGTPTALLFPGGSTDVVLTVTNPNLQQVRLGSLALDTAQGNGGFAVDGGHAGCGTSALGFTTQTNGGSGWTVPAKVGAVDGTLAVTLPASLSMTPAAANACQGASFTVFLAAGP